MQGCDHSSMLLAKLQTAAALGEYLDGLTSPPAQFATECLWHTTWCYLTLGPTTTVVTQADRIGSLGYVHQWLLWEWRLLRSPGADLL